MIRGLNWSLTGGGGAFEIDRESGRVSVVTSTSFTSGDTVRVTISAGKNNATSRSPLTLAIGITDAINDLRLHLKLFLEGPLQ